MKSTDENKKPYYNELLQGRGSGSESFDKRLKGKYKNMARRLADNPLFKEVYDNI